MRQTWYVQSGARQIRETLAETKVKLARVAAPEAVHCALCDKSVTKRLHYHVVSPLNLVGTITVCRSCLRAALGQGYRMA